MYMNNIVHCDVAVKGNIVANHLHIFVMSHVANSNYTHLKVSYLIVNLYIQYQCEHKTL